MRLLPLSCMVAALLLGGPSLSTYAGGNSSASEQTAPTPTATAVEPSALIAHLYAPYLKPDAKPPVPPLLSDEAAGDSPEAYLTGPLKDAVAALMKAQEKDPAFSLGYDPLVDAQDFDITNFRVSPARAVTTEPGKPAVTELDAEFLNFGDRRHLTFRFIKPEGTKRWLLSAVTCKTGSDGRTYDLLEEVRAALVEAPAEAP